jgi:glucose/arabinose dehydrogenase
MPNATAVARKPKIRLSLNEFDDVPHFGFPKCYADKAGFDYEWVNNSKHYAFLNGNSGTLRPYLPYSANDCTNKISPAVYTQAHSSGIGILKYTHPSQNVSRYALPADYDGFTITAQRGSWNRDDSIGRWIVAYKIKRDNIDQYSVDVTTGDSQKMITPPFNKGLFTGSALSDLGWQDSSLSSLTDAAFDLRVVDIQTTQNGVLLVSANSIVATKVTGSPTAGIFAVAHTPIGGGSVTGAVMSWQNSGVNGTFHLVQVITLPCARQMHTVYYGTKQYVVVGTAAALCSSTDVAAGHGNQVWLFEIDTESLSVVSKKQLAKGYYNSMGVTVDSVTYDVIFATSGLTSTEIKAYNRIPDDDASVETASALFKVWNPFALTKYEEPVITRVANLPNEMTDDKHISLNHWWRQIKISPDNMFVLVTMGANCNWNPYCAGGVIAVSLKDGAPYVFSQGQRNALGFMFTTFSGTQQLSVCMTEMNSDMAHGITDDPKTRERVYQNAPFGKINCMDYRTPTVRMSNWLSNPSYLAVQIAADGSIVDETVSNYAMDGIYDSSLTTAYFSNSHLLAGTRNTNGVGT